MRPTPLSILEGARTLIAEEGWCQRALARDRQGNDIGVTDPLAASFCSNGAMIKTGGWTSVASNTAYRKFRLANNITHIQKWNDASERTKDEVIQAFDKAIEYVKRGL